MALTFGAATSDRVALAGGIAAGQSFTVLMWHYPTTRTNGRRWWGSEKSGGGALYDTLWDFTQVGPTFDVPKSAGSATATSTKTYALNKWWLGAFAYSDADGPRIYSGDLATEATEDSYSARATSGASTAAPDFTTLANLNGATLAYQGRVAVFARFLRQMTLSEVIAWQFAPFSDADCDIFMELGYAGTGTQPNLTSLGNGVNGTVTGATVADHVPLLPRFRQTTTGLYVPTTLPPISVQAAAALATFSAPVPAPTETAAATAAASTFAAPAASLSETAGETAATVTFSAPAPTLSGTIIVTATAASSTFSAPVASLQFSAAATASRTDFSAPAAALLEAVQSAASTATFAAPTAAPAFSPATTAARATFSAPAPSAAWASTTVPATVVFSAPVPVSGQQAAFVGPLAFRARGGAAIGVRGKGGATVDVRSRGDATINVEGR